MNQEYEEKGYLVLNNVFEPNELQGLHNVVSQFHESWTQEHAKFYADKAINSAYLTAKKHLNDAEREALFKFIGSDKLMNLVQSVMGPRATFMNTQLFFDPVNQDQKNYWHRDPQYHLSVDEQKTALKGPDVIHVRIPLVDEPGIELIPGTHKRWDSDEELQVRLEQNGHKNHEDLPTGVKVPLSAGDVLVFSANMIHRGLYGMDRLALDILFCDPEPELVKFVEEDCLPDTEIMGQLENPSAFESAIAIKQRNKTSAQA